MKHTLCELEKQTQVLVNLSYYKVAIQKEIDGAMQHEATRKQKNKTKHIRISLNFKLMWYLSKKKKSVMLVKPTFYEKRVHQINFFENQEVPLEELFF